MPDNLMHLLYNWVTVNLAVLCLGTILIWAMQTFIQERQWCRQLRDATVSFVIIGGLSLVFAYSPEKHDATLRLPLTWCLFIMLVVIEFLWVTFFLGRLIHAFSSLFTPIPPHIPPSSAPMGDHGPRTYPR